MPNETYDSIRSLLASTHPDELRQGLKLVKEEISRVGTQEAKPLFELVLPIFYFDPLDRPDLLPILDEAVSLVVRFGDWVVPALVDSLDAGDIKAQLAIGHALGRAGVRAIQPLVTKYRASLEPGRRSFILYSLSKIKSPEIVQAADLAIEAATSADLELRDTATRALGKFAETIPPALLTESLRQKFVQTLRTNLGDANSGIRAKAFRSLGKLARWGHLTQAEREAIKAACQRVLGTDERFEWDRAYIVRKEAEETLAYVR